jgi:hypothetical protein
MSTTRGVRQFQVANYGYTPQSYCINGGFEIWQRGTSFVKTTNTRGFSADEWEIAIGGGSGEQLTVTRNVTPYSGGYCAQLDYVYGTAGTGSYIEQGIEFYKSLQGLPVTFSCWVKCSTANRVRLAVGDLGTAMASAYHTGSGNWEQLTATYVASASIAASPSWPHSYGIVCAIGCLNGSVSGVLVDAASIVIGNYPEGVPYIPKNPEEDFRDCQRFYEVMGNSGPAASICPFFYGVATSSVGQGIQFQTQKAATPTVTKVGTWVLASCGQPTCINADVKGYTLTAAVTVTGLVYFYNNAGTDYITAEVP